MVEASAMSGMIRAQFPYFNNSKSPIFMENAGGSQCPGVVIDAVSNYMRESYVQLDAGYELSTKSTGIVMAAHDFMKDFVNGGGIGEVVFGASTSQLLTTLSSGFSRRLTSEDEIIVQETNHEANAGPWERLASATGAAFKIWPMDPEAFECSLGTLESLLSSRTRFVAVSHVSNLLGGVLELEKVAQLVKRASGGKARIVVDGVAFAPHRALDVKKWGVDWYVFSSYKAYGPHMAVLFGTEEAFRDFEGPNFFYFLPPDNLRAKFELGSVSHESCAGVLALREYLKLLAGDEDSLLGDREVIEAAFKKVKLLEEPLQRMLVEYLRSKAEVVVVGPASTSGEIRVPTICFIHKSKRSSEIARAVQNAGFAIRNGHMYSHRLVTALHSAGKLFNNTVKDGLVRVSMVHYNTVDEVGKLIECLESIL